MKNLPASEMQCPRLELRWEKKDTWKECVCKYSLVLPLSKDDIRRQDENGRKVREELTVFINETERTSSRITPPVDEDTVDTPFRDSSHIRWDCEALGGGLPMYAVCGEFATQLDKFNV